MVRRSNTLRHCSVEPSYFSRPSRGFSGSGAFKRRFVPGAIGQHSEGAVILPFDRSAANAASGDANALFIVKD